MKNFAECFVDGNSELKLGKSALLIVDMLNDFCKEGGCMVLPEGAEIIAPIQELIRAYHEKGLPVIFLNDCHRAGKYDKEFEKRIPHCIEGTWGAEVIEELAPIEEDYCIPKRRFSGFYQNDLDLVLRELEVQTVVVTGVVTNICVRSTCHDAFFLGYNVVVPKDGVRATGPREQESSLWDIETHYGTVTNSAEVLKNL